MPTLWRPTAENRALHYEEYIPSAASRSRIRTPVDPNRNSAALGRRSSDAPSVSTSFEPVAGSRTTNVSRAGHHDPSCHIGSVEARSSTGRHPIVARVVTPSAAGSRALVDRPGCDAGRSRSVPSAGDQAGTVPSGHAPGSGPCPMSRNTYQRYADAGAAGSVARRRGPVPARDVLAEGAPTEEASLRPGQVAAMRIARQANRLNGTLSVRGSRRPGAERPWPTIHRRIESDRVTAGARRSSGPSWVRRIWLR